MVASAYQSFFRLVIAPGEIVLRHTRLVRIEARLSKSLARVRDLATGLVEDVALSDLRGGGVLTHAVRADQHLESFRISSGEHRRCVEGGLKPVSRNAVRARINRLDLKLVS